MVDTVAAPLGKERIPRIGNFMKAGIIDFSGEFDSGILGDVFEIKLSRNSYQRRCDWQTISEYGSTIASMMRYFHNMSYVDISLSLGINLNTVRTKLKRGTAILQEQIERGYER